MRMRRFVPSMLLAMVVGLFPIGPAVQAQATPPKTMTNSIGMEFVLIPAGDFFMGSCKESDNLKEQNKKRAFLGQSPLGAPCPSGSGSDEDASDDETPQHKVQISKAFYLGKHEVTVGQFKKFISEAGRTDLVTDDFMEANKHGDSAAVSHVSWNDAHAFINWLNKKEGVETYRLPTEAEWEYAARAGTTTRYSFGNSAVSLGNYAWFDKNADDAGAKYAHPVGQKSPNPWGLHDMHGNVWEWVQDWYGENYYSNSPSADPKGPSAGSGRVVRGGGWAYFASFCRSADRSYDYPGIRDYLLGFRLSRSLP